MKGPGAKRGRRHKPYHASWGQYINGLRRRKDGRWVIVDTGQTFTEPDERLAIHRFRQWQASQEQVERVEMSVPISALGSRAQVHEAMEAGASLYGSVDGSVGLSIDVPGPVLWSWLRRMLLERPAQVAQQVGIPELAYLSELKPPPASPTLKEVGQLHFDKAEVQRKQRRQTQLFWQHFERWMKRHNVTTLRQLTPTLVAAYADEVKAEAARLRERGRRGGSPTYLKHRFNGIRGVIHFARKRGLPPEDVRHALDCCAVMQPPRHRPRKDPRPISPEHFHQLLRHADEPRMRAALLAMLNLCMYPSEVRNLDWGEIDLSRRTVVTERPKTGVIRIGLLWDETVEALRALRPRRPRDQDPVFLTREQTRWSEKTLTRQFRKLRERAGVPASVKAEHLRDGAYTAAIETGAALETVKLLAGHSTGISDHYLQRRPTMVATVIEGIRAHYFGPAAARAPHGPTAA